MILKNKTTGAIGIFDVHQGEQWQELTETELLLHNRNIAKKQYAAERNAALAEPFVVNISGVDYAVKHSDLSEINSIIGHIRDQTETSLVRWTDIEGNSRHLNEAGFILIRSAIIARAEEVRHTYNEQVRILEGRPAPQLTVLNTFR